MWLDDCSLERVTQAFKSRRIELAVDDLGRSADLPAGPGLLVLSSVEYSSVRIPFVGGQVRVESCAVGNREGSIEVKFGLTTTEWREEEEFSVVEVVVVCRSVEARLDRTVT